MKFEKEIKLLKLFNEKSLKLEKLYILKNVKRIGFSVKTIHKFGRIREKAKRYGPSSKSVDAFALTLRFFLRDRDGISINSINEMYNSLPISAQLQKKISAIKIEVDKHLGSSTNYTRAKYTYTKSDALEIILFGSLAHARSTDKRRQQYETIANDTLIHEILYDSFVNSLLFLLKIIKKISVLNNIAILELQQIRI